MPGEGDSLQLPQTEIWQEFGEGPEQALSRLVQDELDVPKGSRTHQAYGLSLYDDTHPPAVHTSDNKAIFPVLYMVGREILEKTFTIKRPLYHARWFQIPDAIKEFESYGTETGDLQAGVLQRLPVIAKLIEPFQAAEQ
jgi:hypothetical protein